MEPDFKKLSSNKQTLRSHQSINSKINIILFNTLYSAY